jgi:hypothetical protein
MSRRDTVTLRELAAGDRLQVITVRSYSRQLQMRERET